MKFYNSSTNGAQLSLLVCILRAVTLEIQMGIGQYMYPPM